MHPSAEHRDENNIFADATETDMEFKLGLHKNVICNEKVKTEKQYMYRK